eukprot:6204101-Heterocapsa_arctica.AAC.1
MAMLPRSSPRLQWAPALRALHGYLHPSPPCRSCAPCRRCTDHSLSHSSLCTHHAHDLRCTAC